MDRRGRGRSNRRRERTPTPPPSPPPPPPQDNQGQMFGMFREMIEAMNRQQQQNQEMLLQQQQQTQQMLLQQQQAFFQQFNPQQQPRNDNGAGLFEQQQPQQQQYVRPIGLPEFSKLAPQFHGKSTDPADAEFWVTEVEKAFSGCRIEEEHKMGLAEYQLKADANDWWVAKKRNTVGPITWDEFKVMFYEKYFPSSIRDKMLSKLLMHKQGNKSVSEYEAEFNRLVKFTLEGIRDIERTKM